MNVLYEKSVKMCQFYSDSCRFFFTTNCTLSIELSVNNDSTMCAYYKGDINTLTQDDMWAIQYLYGRPK
jgi:hypothetical protein